MINILLADIQPLTVAGLQSFMAALPQANVVGQVTSRDMLNLLLEKHSPDLLIVDYNLEGYISPQDLKTVKDVSPATNVLVISADNSKGSILDVLQLGVKGYLTKDCSREEVLLAIQSTAKGEKFFCHKILDIIMEKHFAAEAPGCDPAILTVRETELLKLIASGKSTQVIADELHLSPHTVHTHRKSIIKKLGIKSPTEFVIYAMDFGLIKAR